MATPWDWDNPLASRLHYLLDNGFETDFTLVFVKKGTNGRKRRIQEIDVHKIFLMMGSKGFFQRIKGSSLDILEMQVEEDQVELFRKMVEFFYVENIDVDIFQAFSLRALAKEFEVPRLVRFCDQVVERFLDENMEKLGQVLEAAMDQGCQELRDECVNRMRLLVSIAEKVPKPPVSVVVDVDLSSIAQDHETSVESVPEGAELIADIHQAEGLDMDVSNDADANQGTSEMIGQGVNMCDKEVLDFISIQAAQDAELLIQTMSSFTRYGIHGTINKRLDALKRNETQVDLSESLDEKATGAFFEGPPEWLDPIMAWKDKSKEMLTEVPSCIIYRLQFSKNLYDWLIYTNNAVNEDQMGVLAEVPFPEKSVSDFASLQAEPDELPIITYYRQRMVKPDAPDEQVEKAKTLRTLETARIRRAVLAFLWSSLEDVCDFLLETNSATTRDGVPPIKQVLEALLNIVQDKDQCAAMISEKFMDKGLSVHDAREFNQERFEAFKTMCLLDPASEDKACWLCSSPPGFIRAVSQQGFPAHAKSLHLVKRRVFKCSEEECKQKFHDNNELKEHLKKEHKIKGVKRSKSMSTQQESPSRKEKKQGASRTPVKNAEETKNPV